MNETGLAERKVVIRELRTTVELLDYFRLRYMEYCRSGFAISPNRDCLDIEPFDFYATFLGAFLQEKGGERLIGGVRMVDPIREGEVALRVREICRMSEDLVPLAAAQRSYPFQLMAVHELTSLLHEYLRNEPSLVEFGRVVVSSDSRQTRLGLELVASIHQLAYQIGKRAGIGYCPRELENFYRKRGCKVLRFFHHPIHEWKAAFLFIDLTKEGTASDGKGTEFLSEAIGQLGLLQGMPACAGTGTGPIASSTPS